MKGYLTTIVIIFFNLSTFSQSNIEKNILDKIQIGYSTRWDIEQLLGKGEMLEKAFLNPNNERDIGNPSWVHSNGLQYKEKGITFICADDGEKISSIYLTPPFRLKINNFDTLQIGKTPLESVFNIDSLKFNTTGASYYWSFNIDKFQFFVSKPLVDRNKDNYINVPSFRDNIDFYKKQPISIVTINLYDYKFFKNEFKETQKKLYCSSPLYAPKNETHKNCFDMGWPDNVFVLLRPFYALTGGQKSKRIKQGYWKEYGSNHKLIYEGKFEDNREIGLFKYYDKEGNLKKTVTFSKSIFNWTYLILVGIVVSIVMFVIKMKRKKNTT